MAIIHEAFRLAIIILAPICIFAAPFARQPVSLDGVPLTRQSITDTLTGTVTGLVTQAVNAASNQVSGYLPVTVNVPDVIRRIFQGLSTGATYVWQNRPAYFVPSGSPSTTAYVAAPMSNVVEPVIAAPESNPTVVVTAPLQ